MAAEKTRADNTSRFQARITSKHVATLGPSTYNMYVAVDNESFMIDRLIDDEYIGDGLYCRIVVGEEYNLVVRKDGNQYRKVVNASKIEKKGGFWKRSQ